MKFLNFSGAAAFAALAVFFAGGCNAHRPAPAAVQEPLNQSAPKDVQLEIVKAPESSTATADASDKAPGMVIHVDPATGKILPAPPSSGEIPQQAAKSQIPAPQLYEVPSPTPGGGIMVDLKGQFLTPLVATVGPDGKVTLEHKSMAPETAKGK